MFYKLQINTAKKIVCNFIHTYRHILLIAQMQSGKTGTALYTALYLYLENKIKNIVIFSGVTDSTLKEQWIESIDEAVSYFEDNHGLKIDRENIEIVWGRDIVDHLPINNSIYIHDESHYAQTIGNRPHKWCVDNEISLNGNDTNLKKKNIYWLSISATPCSELSNIHREEQNKKIIVLPTEDGYTGVLDFVNNRQFYGTNMGEIDKTVFKKICKNIQPNSYCLMRKTSTEFEPFIYKVAKKYNIKIKTYNSKNTSNIKSIEELNKEPDQKTIIFISGKLRCGKRLPVKYVSTIVNSSQNPNTDTLLQGLIGRCCGYKKSNFNIKFYVSELSWRGIMEYVNAVNNNFNVGVGKSKNVPNYNDTVDFPKTNKKEVFYSDLTDIDFCERFSEMIHFYINKRTPELTNIKLNKKYYSEEKFHNTMKEIQDQYPNIDIQARVFYNDYDYSDLQRLTVFPSKKHPFCLREICKAMKQKISGKKKDLIDRIYFGQMEQDDTYIYILNIQFNYPQSTVPSNASISDCSKCTECNEKYCVNECTCDNCIVNELNPYIIKDIGGIITQYYQ